MTKLSFNFSFFGSKQNTVFDRKKSLFSNIVDLCSLPFPKTRSTATHNLFSIMQVCELKCSGQGKNKEPRNDIVHDIYVLQIALLAIKSWKNERSKASTRTSLIDKFNAELINMQRDLITQDRKLFMDQVEQCKNKSQGLVWQNPLNPLQFATEKALEMDLLKYLQPKQKDLLVNLNKNPNIALSKINLDCLINDDHKQQNKIVKFHSICLPLLSSFMDLDTINLIVDNLNSLWDMARVF